MRTIRVSEEIYEEILAQKRGNDTINDIVLRWYLGYALLQKTSPEELVKLPAFHRLRKAKGGA